MLTMNAPWYAARRWAPQIHSGSGDFMPDPGGSGEGPLVPPGMPPILLSTLPNPTWGAAWASAPAPGEPGQSYEVLAIWSGLGPPPAIPAEHRVPSPVRYVDRVNENTHFPSASSFKAAVAARQVALGRDVLCLESTGDRYADLNTNFSDASLAAETRDVLRISDGSKVGEAFLYRANNATTVQHWVLRSDERFDQVRVVKRPANGYASLSAFLSAQAAAKPQGVSWPHTVETCTHYLSCPW